jgi:hypothetical protein
MERNARGASLVPRDELGVPVARFRVPALRLQRLDGGGRRRIRLAGRQTSRLSS